MWHLYVIVQDMGFSWGHPWQPLKGVWWLFPLWLTGHCWLKTSCLSVLVQQVALFRQVQADAAIEMWLLRHYYLVCCFHKVSPCRPLKSVWLNVQHLVQDMGFSQGQSSSSIKKCVTWCVAPVMFVQEMGFSQGQSLLSIEKCVTWCGAPCAGHGFFSKPVLVVHWKMCNLMCSSLCRTWVFLKARPWQPLKSMPQFRRH